MGGRRAVARRTEADKRFQQEDRDIPAPKPDEVQIKVAMTGLCGSDREYPFELEYPLGTRDQNRKRSRIADHL